jgi:hypothetical protein
MTCTRARGDLVQDAPEDEPEQVAQPETANAMPYRCLSNCRPEDGMLIATGGDAVPWPRPAMRPEIAGGRTSVP